MASNEKGSVQECERVEEPPFYTEEEVNKAIRAVDWRIMPLMMFTYTLSYYDKAMLSQAVLFNMRQDLGILTPASRYSLVSSIFYMGYLAGCFPISYLVQKLPTGKSCAVLTFFWGIVNLCTIFAHNYAGILCQRFALGVIEAAVAPTFTAAIGVWYPKKEQSFRVALWYGCSPASQLFAPLVNYGLGSIKGSLPGWKNMYLFAGLVTIVWSVLIYAIWPTDIATARFLTERQRLVLQDCVQRNNAGGDSRTFRLAQFIECFKDLNVIGLFLLAVCTHWSNGAVSSFGSLLVKQLGFTVFQTLLLQLGVGFLGSMVVWVPAWVTRKHDGLIYHFHTSGLVLPLVGSLVVWLGPEGKPLLAGFYLMAMFSLAASMLIAMAATNVGGYTKRLTTGVIIFVGYCVANIGAPLTFDAAEAPKFPKGFSSTVGTVAAGIVIGQLLRLLMKHRNAKRDALYGPPCSDMGLEDQSDFQNKNFRYLLPLHTQSPRAPPSGYAPPKRATAAARCAANADSLPVWMVMRRPPAPYGSDIPPVSAVLEQAAGSEPAGVACGSAPPARLDVAISEELEAIFARRTGGADAVFSEGEDFDPPFESRLPTTGPDDAFVTVTSTHVETFLRTMQHVAPFLTASIIWSVFADSCQGAVQLEPGRAALLDMVGCLGSFRALTFDTNSATYITLQEASRIDVAFFQRASATLEVWGGASLEALQALFLQYIYVSSTSPGKKARRILGRAVRMAHDDLMLNRRATYSHAALDGRAAMLYFYTFFADCQHSSLCGLSPLIKLSELDTLVLGAPILLSGINVDDTVTGSQCLPALARIMLIQSEALDFLGQTDGCIFQSIGSKLDGWAKRLAEEMASSSLTTTGLVSTAAKANAAIYSIHLNWTRILIFYSARRIAGRANMGTTAVLARSASQIIASYHLIFSNGHFNLSWHQLRRVTTCAHLIIICFTLGEIAYFEACELLQTVCQLLAVLQTRWQQARPLYQSISTVATALVMPNPRQPQRNLFPNLSIRR
ncbi:major facilitator superfamily domain-containing protein [Pseudohyphozyma bogoriensis]|nr:major facilitator superfamily domain-containing protein [Pseudohyphozyma bogoriensis]